MKICDREDKINDSLSTNLCRVAHIHANKVGLPHAHTFPLRHRKKQGCKYRHGSCTAAPGIGGPIEMENPSPAFFFVCFFYMEEQSKPISYYGMLANSL